MKHAQIAEPGAEPFLYQRVIDLIRGQIGSGTLRPGDRLPSLRSLSTQLELSVPTVRQAYLELERSGRIEARPKSGYFVKPIAEAALVRKKPCSSRPRAEPVTIRCRELIDEVYDGIHHPAILPLGAANPSMALPATKTLHRAMKRVMSRAEERVFAYAPTNGEPALQRQLAYRALNQGLQIDPDDIVVTNGAQEAMALALQSVASPGDVIAVESPCYHGQLELIESSGMLALEIDTCPIDGVEVDALQAALDAHSIGACIFSSAINNPLGSRMPDAARKRMVELLEKHGVPLIEDDVYGELAFHGQRPRPGQFYAKKGGVITCSSFSKTVAPGYRTGWIYPGRFHAEIVKRKRALSCATGLLAQLALAEFIGSGDYDRYLRRLVPVLRENAQRMACLASHVFPESTRLSRPQGGSVLWVEVPGLDSVALFRSALAANISIVPGVVFAARNRYRSFFRISYGHPWTEEVEEGMRKLGQLVTEHVA